MKHIYVAMALLALAAAAEAGDVPDDSQWVGGGGDETITVSVTDDPLFTGGSVTYSVTDSTGASGTENGSMGTNGTDLHPTVGTGDEATTPGGNDYRANNGKMERRGRDGTWKQMRMKKKKSCKGSNSFDRLQAGEPAPHAGRLYSNGRQTIPLLKDERAPWEGILGGEEVTSLPGDP